MDRKVYFNSGELAPISRENSDYSFPLKHHDDSAKRCV